MGDHKHTDSSVPGDGGRDGSMAGTMGMMMAMCAGIILLLVLLPTLGFPLGLVAAIGAVALMLVLHGRFMRHGSGTGRGM